MIEMNVTQEDIDTAIEKREKGEPYYDISESCPMALAYQRTIRDPNAAWGFRSGFKPVKDDEPYSIETHVVIPEQDHLSRQFTNDFDLKRYDLLKPTTFMIEEIEHG